MNSPYLNNTGVPPDCLNVSSSDSKYLSRTLNILLAVTEEKTAMGKAYELSGGVITMYVINCIVNIYPPPPPPYIYISRQGMC
jgi:hypothetical protein